MVRWEINPQIKRLIKIIGKQCADWGINAYLVGGSVRDLFLGKSNIDLDIVLDKDVGIIIIHLAKIFSARYVYHPQFKTAKLFLENISIDMATAREEIYYSIGSLPQVRISSEIERDLFRRDFTINAMAIRISKGGLSDLIDPYNGLEDLRKRRIRVLHKKSFLDDPTRIIRAIRFSTRFDFSLEENTLIWLKEAVCRDVFSRISPVRLGNEIVRLLQEKNPLKAIEQLRQLCSLKIIHPQIRFNRKWRKYFPQIPRWSRDFGRETSQSVEEWLIYFIFLTEKLNKEALQRLCLSYELEKHKRLLVLHALKLRKIEKIGFLHYKNSELFNLLKPISPESIIYLIIRVKGKLLKKKLFEFLVRFFKTRLYTDGERLKELGFSPGPIFNKVLETIFLAKLDGFVSTKKEEENLIEKKFLSRQ
ncbi:MAG: hypothetical protein NC898_00920 [Candidatus Omnitrophica bacterium]|nr:hypothetical protein [Candidatus Omnitrophota bacterium]MCM8793017.1 hypothetical protein [Candidatus Omnitrophota bacterium]